ncbi:MAG TPA: hypothetical protein VMU19_13860 [Bryobacteraceae bacterium]|nr:hypothetical protein [Bryobacteraceae bacterium]
MPVRVLAGLLTCVCLLPAAPPKTIATAMGENGVLALTVTLYIDAPGVKELIGDDLGGYYIVADVKVEPKGGREVSVSRDDFLLRTDKDGDKATPSSPGQIAGQGAITVREVKAERPPGPAGSGGGDNMVPTGASAQNGTPGRVSSLEQTLRERLLPEQKTNQPFRGLLYFLMDKQKMKDLELVYGSGAQRIDLRFK